MTDNIATCGQTRPTLTEANGVRGECRLSGMWLEGMPEAAP